MSNNTMKVEITTPDPQHPLTLQFDARATLNERCSNFFKANIGSATKFGDVVILLYAATLMESLDKEPARAPN